ncbi:ribosomal protein S9, putative [Perkinsus marinus ATCC 50983]|uniref:Ribosomal protein S9, putative n=2 Tax=Perkinsus marinus (strain ATCC 50983 / TXsc) TaxID=423536 RepID=C5KA46_PERM5|nr:ribosomal protein S9, putative [Perkinsus marinus ATCC 50983]EER18647.1 ribosomal protein S9, putative [Perkinsus marinus ATCC 50983]|eukprot:XP_002786851.1 ribosomal protein S9, putative [Perkinsus marinus ATCC 50983]
MRSMCTAAAHGEKAEAAEEEKIRKDAEPLSLNQALYLTTELGLYTTREMQLRVMKSPSFSTDSAAPFVLEDFFNSMDEGFKKAEEEFEVLHVGEEEKGTAEEQQVDEEKVDTVNSVIHNKLVRAFTTNPKEARSFVYNGEEWKERAEGRGLRKRATAHVVLQRGSGVIKVNGDEDFYVRFPLYYNR